MRRAFTYVGLLSLLAATGCAGSNATPLPAVAHGRDAMGNAQPEMSTAQKMANAVTSVFKGDATTPVQAEGSNEPDTLSLDNTKEPTPDLLVLMAQMHERSGNPAAAAEQYGKALKANPQHQGALLGLARLQDHQGDLNAAIITYKRAVGLYPNNATIHNDLALCLSRAGRHGEAIESLTTATRLQPTNVLYRNNLATILVQQGQTEPALAHLIAVHPQAVAHYNLGYLLKQQGHVDAARHHFATAAQLDPSFEAALRWTQTLQSPTR